jgi:uncharacterized membrane protein
MPKHAEALAGSNRHAPPYPERGLTSPVGPLARVAFAAGLAGIGVHSLVSGDYALQWQPVPPSLPLRAVVVYASGSLQVACGAGLLIRRTAALSSLVLAAFLGVWLLLTTVPPVVMTPLVEVTWLNLGQVAVLVAGAWVLYATRNGSGAPKPAALTGERGVRLARLLFGIALPAIGVSHFTYLDQAVALVPAWLPDRVGWACFTGAAHIAAGLGVLFGVYARLAATLWAGMIGVFTVAVWIPAVAAAGAARFQWSEFVLSWVIAAGAWVVADSYAGIPWLERRTNPQGEERQ